MSSAPGHEEESAESDSEADPEFTDPLDFDDEEPVGLDDSTGLASDDDLGIELDIPTDDAEGELESEIDLSDGLMVFEESLDDDDEGPDEEVVEFEPLAVLDAADGGEEGVDENLHEELVLPPLMRHGEDDEEGPDDAEIELPPLAPLQSGAADGAEESESAIAVAPRLELRQLLEEPIKTVAVGDGKALAAGRSLWQLDGESVEAVAWMGPGVEAIAALKKGWAVCDAEGALVQLSQSLQPCGRCTLPLKVEALTSDEGDQLWLLRSGGGLFSTSDHGQSVRGPLLARPVAAFASSPFIALSVGVRATPQLLRFAEGRGWTTLAGPDVSPLGVGKKSLTRLGAAIAVASDDDATGIHFSDDEGRSWKRIEGLPHAEAILLAPSGDAKVLWAVVRRGDVRWLERRRLNGESNFEALRLAGCGHVNAIVLHEERVLIASETGLFAGALP